VFAALEEHNVAPSAVLNVVAGKTEAAFGQAIRDNLRTAMLDVINNPNVAPSERARLLQRFLDAQPSNGDRGELFSQFRRTNPLGQVETLNLGPGSTTLQGTTRRADGALQVLDPPAGSRGLQPGTYLVEDKAGPGAFRLDQAQRYSEALKAGQITAANGQQYRGLVYFFSNRAAAEAAVEQIDGLNQSIHVAYYSERGTVGWLR